MSIFINKGSDDTTKNFITSDQSVPYIDTPSSISEYFSILRLDEDCEDLTIAEMCEEVFPGNTELLSAIEAAELFEDAVIISEDSIDPDLYAGDFFEDLVKDSEFVDHFGSEPVFSVHRLGEELFVYCEEGVPAIYINKSALTKE